MAEASHVPMTVDLEPVQHVDPDGAPTAESRYSRDLPVETLCWLYEMMMVTRDVDTEFVNLQRQGELALFASCCGQEAAQVGAAACLRGGLAVSAIPRIGRLPGARHPCGPRRRRVAWNLAWRNGFHSEVLRSDIDSDRHPDVARGRRGDGGPTARRRLRHGGLPRRRRHQ